MTAGKDRHFSPTTFKVQPMKDAKFLVEVDSVRFVGTLEQCTQLITLLSQMQTAKYEYDGEPGYTYYPDAVSLEMKALVGRNRWAEKKPVKLPKAEWDDASQPPIAGVHFPSMPSVVPSDF